MGIKNLPLIHDNSAPCTQIRRKKRRKSLGHTEFQSKDPASHFSDFSDESKVVVAAGGGLAAGEGGRHLSGDDEGEGRREGTVAAIQILSSDLPLNHNSPRTVADLFLPPAGVMSTAAAATAAPLTAERAMVVGGSSSAVASTPTSQDMESFEKRVLATFQRYV